MERKTCTKCGVEEVLGNPHHDYAHIIPRWFCKDSAHYETLLLVLCRSCHQKLDRAILEYVVRWVRKSE